jgi:hypothetical protein
MFHSMTVFFMSHLCRQTCFAILWLRIAIVRLSFLLLPLLGYNGFLQAQQNVHDHL